MRDTFDTTQNETLQRLNKTTQTPNETTQTPNEMTQTLPDTTHTGKHIVSIFMISFPTFYYHTHTQPSLYKR